MKELLHYYQKELSYLYRHGKAFARQFPKVARRLGLSEGKSEDPHIERLIESVALLTAQIHQRLDNDIHQISGGLMQTLAPQLMRTFPSACIVQFNVDKKSSGMTSNRHFDAGMCLTSDPIDGQTCRFETLYPVTLWPASLDSVALAMDSNEMYWCLQLNFSIWPGARVEDNRLRLHLNGNAIHVNTLYALLSSEIRSMSIVVEEQQTELFAQHTGEVGFAAHEELYNRGSSISATHSLMHDYLLFPHKFHFIDLPLPSDFSVESGKMFSYRIVFNRCTLARQLNNIANSIDCDFFRLNCTPALNLYTQRAEPINLNADSAEYPVCAEVRGQKYVHVWSVNNVKIQRTIDNQTESRDVYPLLGLHNANNYVYNSLFWQQLQRDIILDGDIRKNTVIAFADRNGENLLPQGDVAVLEVSCHNGELPARMQNGDPKGDFHFDMPLAGITCSALTRPTEPRFPPDNSAGRWRLISQLSLNHMLLSGPHGCQVLKDTLALYNFTGSSAFSRQINMINLLEVTPVNQRLITNDPHSLARGVEIKLTFSSEAEHESEYFLFCRILDRFLGLYAPVNSFSRLITEIDRVDDSRYQWPIRAGRLSWI